MAAAPSTSSSGKWIDRADTLGACAGSSPPRGAGPRPRADASPTTFAERAGRARSRQHLPGGELAGDGRGRVPRASPYRPSSAASTPIPYEFLLAQERLAQGDGATALAVNMHLTTCSSFRSLWRRTGDERAEGFLRRVVEHEVDLRLVHVRGGLRRRARGLRDDRDAHRWTALPARRGARSSSPSPTSPRTSRPARGSSTRPRPAHGVLQRDPDRCAGARDHAHVGHARHARDPVERPPARGRRSSRGEALFHAYPVGHLDAGIGLSIMSLNVPSFGVDRARHRDGGHGARPQRRDRSRPRGQRRGAARVRGDGGAARVGARRALPPCARDGGVRPRGRSSR